MGNVEQACENERGAWIPRKVAADFDARGKPSCGYKSTITIAITISGERRNAKKKNPKNVYFLFPQPTPSRLLLFVARMIIDFKENFPSFRNSPWNVSCKASLLGISLVFGDKSLACFKTPVSFTMFCSPRTCFCYTVPIIQIEDGCRH